MGIGSSHSRGRVELERKVCRHLFPFKYVLKPWPLERDVGGGQRGELRGQFMANTEQGVYQYVVVRTLFAVLELLAHLVGLHGEGEWQNPRRLFLWQMLIVNASQTWALYCLVLFYHELHPSLHALKPFGKFIAIKCVIFLSFWQAVVISLLAYSGAIHETHGSLEYSQKDITKGLQDFLICVEMALAAVLHRTTFSYRDFASGGALLSALGRRHRLMPSRKALVEMLPLDVVADAQVKGSELVGHVTGSRKAGCRPEAAALPPSRIQS